MTLTNMYFRRAYCKRAYHFKLKKKKHSGDALQSSLQEPQQPFAGQTSAFIKNKSALRILYSSVVVQPYITSRCCCVRHQFE